MSLVPAHMPYIYSNIDGHTSIYVPHETLCLALLWPFFPCKATASAGVSVFIHVSLSTIVKCQEPSVHLLISNNMRMTTRVYRM